jgi:hypothetical protein
MRYRLKPADLHREILKLLIPEEILRLDGVSAVGKRGCVAIPSNITNAVLSKFNFQFKK